MSAQPNVTACAWNLMGQQGSWEPAWIENAMVDMWPYRTRTASLLRKYGRAAVEVGRLPSLLGREFFRARVTSYSMANFEDVVIFVADMEQALEKLSVMEKRIVALGVLEEYTVPEVSRLLQCPQRTVERQLHDALDHLSWILLEGGILERLPQVD